MCLFMSKKYTHVKYAHGVPVVLRRAWEASWYFRNPCAVDRADKAPVIFWPHFKTCQGLLLFLDLGEDYGRDGDGVVSLSIRIKDSLMSWSILEFLGLFLIKASFGTQMGRYMLFHRSPGFYRNHDIFCVYLLSPIFRIGNHRKRSHVRNSVYGYPASLDMRMINRSMNRWYLTSLRPLKNKAERFGFRCRTCY